MIDKRRELFGKVKYSCSEGNIRSGEVQCYVGNFADKQKAGADRFDFGTLSSNYSRKISSLLLLFSLLTLSTVSRRDYLIKTFNVSNQNISVVSKENAVKDIESIDSLVGHMIEAKPEITEKQSQIRKAIESTKENTPMGRFVRAYLWDNVISMTEKKYKIPKGLLAGLAMQESYGNPLKTNNRNDGGAGMFMFQPGTARKELRLKVYGNSNATGRDRTYGKKLAEIIAEHKRDYKTLSKIDERLDVQKSTDAAARYLLILVRKWGLTRGIKSNSENKRTKAWDKAISAYNRGRPARFPRETTHVKKVRDYQAFYNAMKTAIENNPNFFDDLTDANPEFIRVNEKGMHIYRQRALKNTDIIDIAKNFNQWNKEIGRPYQTVKASNVVNKRRKPIKKVKYNNQKVYISAMPSAGF